MILTKEKIKYFQEKLEKEKEKLEKELARIGKRNPEVPGDWEVAPVDLNVESSEGSEVSVAFEEMENRVAIENSLEERLVLVNEALARIKDDRYGICADNSGKTHSIGLKHLEANPSATKCTSHI